MTHQGTGTAPALWAGLRWLIGLDSGQAGASPENATSHCVAEGLSQTLLLGARHAQGNFCRVSSCVILKTSCPRLFNTVLFVMLSEHRKQPNVQTED